VGRKVLLDIASEQGWGLHTLLAAQFLSPWFSICLPDGHSCTVFWRSP